MTKRLLLLLLPLIIAGGCAVPQLPSGASWDTEIAVPLAGKTYSLWEIAESDSVLQADGSGVGMTLPDSALFFSYTKNLAAIRPAESLSFDPIVHTISNQAHGLRIPFTYEQTEHYSLTALNPALANRHGTVQTVAPFPVSIVVEVPLSDLFSEACVDSGDIHVHLANSLPFAVNSANLLWYANRDDASSLYSGTMPAVYESDFTRGLGSSCLQGSMVLELTGTAGGGAQIVIDSTQGLDVSISLGEFIASSYVGLVPQQVMRADSSYPLNQEHSLDNADIATGELTVTLSNQSQLPDSVTITLPNLREANGTIVRIKQLLLPQQTKQTVLNLGGYSLRLPGIEHQDIDGTLETVSIETDHVIHYSGAGQQVTAEFRTGDLTFHRFTGILNNLETTIARDSSEVEDIPDGWENIHPAALDMRLNLNASVAATAALQMNLYSTDNGQPVGQETRLAEVWLGQDTSLLFTGLQNLVPTLPEWIGYTGLVTVNGAATIWDTSTVSGTVELSAPLLFTVDATTIPGDAEKVEPEDLEDIQEIVLTVQLWNGLPVSGTVKILAADDSLAVTENTESVETIAEVTLPEAVLDQGRVIGEGYQEYSITPPAGFYELLQHPPFYVRTELQLDGSNGETLAAYGTDHVRIAATARVRYRVEWEN